MGLTFSLAAGAVPSRDLAVTAFTGREGVSRLFVFDVAVTTERDLGGESLLGASAVLAIRDARGIARAVRGVVARVTAVARPEGRGARSWRVRIVPKLWLGKHRVTCRVFQHLSVPEVVKTVLDAAKVPCELRLAASHPERDYCVQYRESDFAFVRRILAEEGIFWFFRHGADANEVAIQPDPIVLVDHPSAYERLDPEVSHLAAGASRAPLLRLRDSDIRGASDDELTRFERAHSVRPDSLLLRDYDFQRPLRDLRAASRHEDAPDGLEIYDYRGEYAEPDVALDRAARHLEAHRRRALIGQGESSVRTLVPGYRVEIDTTGTAQLGGEYAITEVRHHGEVAGGSDERVYRNTFRCVPASIAARPRRPERRVLQCLETAVVTGPAGEEIHTDEHGRVRVEFHWSLAGGGDETSTTWLRVMQSWAGPSWGTQFIPRVGSEVMVSFLGGDPDCPVVVGSVYNPARPHPFKLPEHKTKSGLRTSSSPGGGGFNELSFEDAAGEECVFLHAQRDLVEQIEHDHVTHVRHAQRVEVRANQQCWVGGDRHDHVLGRCERTVVGDESIRVEASRGETIGGNDVTRIEGERHVSAGSEKREVRGTAEWSVARDLTIKTKGSLTTLVGAKNEPRSYGVHVEGPIELSSDVSELVATKGIRLRCGESVIEVLPDRIELVSPKLALRSPNARVVIDGDDVSVHAKKGALVKSHTIMLKGDHASASFRSEAKVDGARILLNSPEQAIDPPPEKPEPPTIIELADENGKPLGHRHYVLVLSDGSERSGFLDKDGRAEIDLREPAAVRFPGLASA